jgi:hypothetical protein
LYQARKLYRTDDDDAAAATLDNFEYVIDKDSFIYSKNNWDAAPIVIPHYKLMVFTTPKVACTLIKHTLRKLMYPNITTNTTILGDSFVHDPSKNGLLYLHDFTIQEANEMLTSSEWTRVVFVRNPKERVLSAHLDKGRRNNGTYLQRHCGFTISTFEEFIHKTIPNCVDMHWLPQAYRMEAHLWKYINFVGRVETIHTDLERLLKRIGAADTSIIRTNNKTTVKHATGAHQLLQQYYTPQLEAQVEDLYRVDYQHQVLNLTLEKIKWES